MKRSAISLVLTSAFVFAAHSDLRAQNALSAQTETPVPIKKDNDQNNEKLSLIAVMPKKTELPQGFKLTDKKLPHTPCVPQTLRQQQRLQERFNKQKLPQKHAQRGFAQRKHGMDNRRFG